MDKATLLPVNPPNVKGAFQLMVKWKHGKQKKKPYWEAVDMSYCFTQNTVSDIEIPVLIWNRVMSR